MAPTVFNPTDIVRVTMTRQERHLWARAQVYPRWDEYHTA